MRSTYCRLVISVMWLSRICNGKHVCQITKHIRTTFHDISDQTGSIIGLGQLSYFVENKGHFEISPELVSNMDPDKNYFKLIKISNLAMVIVSSEK